MAKSMRNQRMVTNPPKRVANQQDSYERLRPKPTGPGVVSVTVPRIRDVDKPAPADARRHADGKNHENPKAKPVKSLLSREPDEGQHKVPSTVKFAPGVPNDKNLRRGYYPPDARLGTKPKNLSGNTDYNTPATYSQQVHNDY